MNGDFLCGQNHQQSCVVTMRRLVKNIGWANQTIWGGQKVVKSDQCMGVSQFFGARA